MSFATSRQPSNTDLALPRMKSTRGVTPQLATLDEIFTWLRSDTHGDVQRAAWDRFFHDTANCQAFLNAIMAGEAVPITALLIVAREQFNMHLFDVMLADPQWAPHAMPVELGWSETATVLWWQRHGHRDNHHRIAQLADLPDTPATDAKLAELQRVLTTNNHAEIVLALGEPKRFALLRAKLLQTLCDGYVVSTTAMREIARTFEPDDFLTTWGDASAFDDDEHFTQEGFVAQLVRAREIGVNWTEIGQRAAAQVFRMLAAGRIDVDGIGKHLKDVAVGGGGAGRPMYLEEALAPYDNNMLQSFDRALSFVAKRGSSLSVAQHAGVTTLLAQRDEHIAARERLFAEVWLPGILPAAEAAAIVGLPGSFLRELYVAQWEQGYEAYRAAVMGR